MSHRFTLLQMAPVGLYVLGAVHGWARKRKGNIRCIFRVWVVLLRATTPESTAALDKCVALYNFRMHLRTAIRVRADPDATRYDMGESH